MLAAAPHCNVQAPLEAIDKLAPEWQPLLQQLEQLLPRLHRLAQRGSGAAALEEAAAEALHVAVEWDAAAQQLLVGAQVTFPRHMAPLHAAQQQGEDAGAAALVDWGPLLGQLFGARVQRAGGSSALVLAPAPHLAAVLDWLAQRPVVTWAAPAAVARAANWRAAAVTQVVGWLGGWVAGWLGGWVAGWLGDSSDGRFSRGTELVLCWCDKRRACCCCAGPA